MMPGDLPCNLPCVARWCRYNLFGHCTDNCTCGARIDPDRTDDEEDEEDKEDEEE
jgi:hypothetical protein